PNKEILEPLFSELEFRTLGKRVFGEEFSVVENSKPATAQMDLFASPIADSLSISDQETEAPATAASNIHNTTHEYILADEISKIQALANDLANQKLFCFDTESTGLDALTADIVGLSFSYEKGKAYYVPTPADKEA